MNENSIRMELRFHKNRKVATGNLPEHSMYGIFTYMLVHFHAKNVEVNIPVPWISLYLGPLVSKPIG